MLGESAGTSSNSKSSQMPSSRHVIIAELSDDPVIRRSIRDHYFYLALHTCSKPSFPLPRCALFSSLINVANKLRIEERWNADPVAEAIEQNFVRVECSSPKNGADK